MGPTFGQQGLPFHQLVHSMAVVCPDSDPPPVRTSEWAQKVLNFTPSAKQAEVLDSTARFLALCCNRQWGKTTTIAIKATHHAIKFADQSIVILSRSKLQAGILIERARRFAIQAGQKIRRVLGHQFSLQLPNGSQIFAVAHNTSTSVGPTANILIVDEAALVKDIVYFAASPFTARTHGAIWLLSTASRPAGFFYNIFRGTDTDWHRIKSTVEDCPDICRKYLAMQRLIDEVKYRQDFLCEFVQPADRAFTEELVDMATKNRNPHARRPL